MNSNGVFVINERNQMNFQRRSANNLKQVQMILAQQRENVIGVESAFSRKQDFSKTTSDTAMRKSSPSRPGCR